MKKKNTVSRQSFIKKSAGAAVAFTVLPSYLALGKTDSAGNVPPSRRINLACIGSGGQACTVIPALTREGNAKVVAFCDVDFSRQKAELMAQHSDAKRFADFRVMFDTMGDDIDAVSVVTPDHVHYVQTLEAMRRGKHVYTEKPLTHSFMEAEVLMRAEEKYGVVTQMGNHGHTSSGAMQFQQLVAAGVITDIVKVEAFKTPSLWFMNADERISQFPAEEAIPQSLNYDLWCGPAKMMPFSHLYHPASWRAFYLYGNGMLGDWGAHIIDFAHDFLKLGLPTRVEALGMDDHNQVIFPLQTRISMQFPERGAGLPACELIWRDGGQPIPEVDRKYWNIEADGEAAAPKLGDAGTLLHRADEKFLIQRGSHGSASRLTSWATMLDYRAAFKAPRSTQSHQEGFIQACMGNGKTSSPFSVSGELTQVLMLGVIAQYLNESFSFDPTKKKITDNRKANELLRSPTPRKGWEEYYRKG
jgi:predicted dehydrogenase